jgi:uncharacterized protein
MHDGSDWMALAVVLLLLGIAAYLLPLSIAASRSHPNTIAIAALNILLGWTMLGWIAALVWALTAIEKRNAPSHSPTSRGGATRSCPFCAEPVLVAAIKCRHCGSDLEAPIEEQGRSNLPLSGVGGRPQTPRPNAWDFGIGVVVVITIALGGSLAYRLIAAKASRPESSGHVEASDSTAANASATTLAAPSNEVAAEALQSEARPSFDCVKARSATETLICQDQQLSSLDADLAKLYAEAKAAAPGQGEFRRETSAAWMDREKKCSDKQCLLAWYAARKTALSAHLSEAGAVRAGTVIPQGVKQNDPAVLSGTLSTGTFENCCFDGNPKTEAFWSVHLAHPIVFTGPDENPGTVADVQLGGFQQGSLGGEMKGKAVTVQCSSLFEGMSGHFAERVYCADAKIVSH